MTCLNFTLPASGTVPALLTLAQPLTAQALLELKHAVIGTLAMLGRDLFGAGVVAAPEHAASRLDTGMSFSPAELQAVIGDMTEALREQGIGTVEVAEIVNVLYTAREAASPR